MSGFLITDPPEAIHEFRNPFGDRNGFLTVAAADKPSPASGPCARCAAVDVAGGAALEWNAKVFHYCAPCTAKLEAAANARS